MFYCPGPRPPRGGTSLEKLLPLIHPLDDHLTVHVAHLTCVNAVVGTKVEQTLAE